MFRVHVVVRETGGLTPEYALDFDIPTLPRVGTYLSVQRPDAPAGLTEDLIVRQVWWRLRHPDRGRSRSPEAAGGVGELSDIFIECAKAIGPYSTAAWRMALLAAETNGHDVEVFDVQPAPFTVGNGAEEAPAVSRGALRSGARRRR
jgi:hypothetical protein